MTRHSLFLALALVLAASSGCCCMNSSMTSLSGCTGCGSSDCGGSCGGGGPSGGCNQVYGGMRYECGDSCQRSCWGFPLFRNLFNCTGCGETYWNEWNNDPPACRDACDCHGNWTGSYGGYRGGYEEGPMMDMEYRPTEPTPAVKSAPKTVRRPSRVVRYSNYSKGIARGR